MNENIKKRLSTLINDGYDYERKGPKVINHIKEHLIIQKMSMSDLCQKTGISKQTMNLIVHDRINTVYELAIKISIILKTDVQELFELLPSAWTELVKINGKALYFDIACEEYIQKDVMQKIEIELGKQYYDSIQNQLVLEEEYQRRLEDYLALHLLEEISIVEKDSNIRKEKKVIRKIALDNLTEQFNQDYLPRFLRVVKRLNHS